MGLKFNPGLLAQWLQEVWHELGGNPQLAPPGAWLTVAERLQQKITVNVLKEAAVIDVADVQGIGQSPGLLEAAEVAALDPNSPPIVLQMAEPRPMLATVPIVFEFGDLLADTLRGLPFQEACQMLFGNNAGKAATAKDPTITELPAIINRSRPLLALLPLMIDPQPGVEWLPINCDFCSRRGLLGKAQYALKTNSDGFALCPVCIARLVGQSAQGDIIRALWGSDAAAAHPDKEPQEQFPEQDADDASEDQAGHDGSHVENSASDQS